MANKKPKVIFLSLPMSGRSDAEIEHQIEEMEGEARNINPHYTKCVHNLGCVIPQVLIDNVDQPALLYLGKAIQIMSSVDAVMMGEGWETARGCLIEYQVAKQYMIPIYNSKGERIGQLLNTI